MESRKYPKFTITDARDIFYETVEEFERIKSNYSRSFTGPKIMRHEDRGKLMECLAVLHGLSLEKALEEQYNLTIFKKNTLHTGITELHSDIAQYLGTFRNTMYISLSPRTT